MKRIVRAAVAVLFVLIGIGLAFVGYLWFSGRLETRHQRVVTVMFDDVTGLRAGDPVQVQGVPEGKVLRLTFEGGKIKCVLGLDRSIVPTEDTKFAIHAASYISSDRYITVALGNGPPAGDGYVYTGANEVLNLDDTFLRLSRVLADFHPSDLGKEIGDQARELVREISAQLGQLSGGINAEVGHFNEGLNQFNSNFAATTGEINRLGGTLDSLRGLLGNGSTASKLLDTDELYQEVRKTNQQVQALLEDIKKNPGRYVTVKLF
jgi:phospholipid/cholesterol/gamma-HCH transport system substrate-binding protein